MQVTIELAASASPVCDALASPPSYQSRPLEDKGIRPSSLPSPRSQPKTTAASAEISFTFNRLQRHKKSSGTGQAEI